MSNLLGRDAFRAAAKHLKTRTVEFPEFGGAVTIRALTAGESVEIASKARDSDTTATFLYVLLAVIDENGAPMFADMAEVQALNSDVVLRIATEASKFNNATTPDEAEKNSEASLN